MAIHGFTREKRQQLIKEIAKFIKGNRNLDKEAWAWYDIPSSMFGSHNNYQIMLDWQEGYDEDEKSEFIENGYGLNVSIRVDHDMYFACDNPYPVLNKLGDCLDGLTVYSDNDFMDVANDVVHMLKTALTADDMNVKGLELEEQENLFEIADKLNLYIGKPILIGSYDDEDVMDFIDENGDKHVVSDFSYYDGTVWVENCDYGIDIQHVFSVD